jgi:hypothetical protein
MASHLVVRHGAPDCPAFYPLARLGDIELRKQCDSPGQPLGQENYRPDAYIDRIDLRFQTRVKPWP